MHSTAGHSIHCRAPHNVPTQRLFSWFNAYYDDVGRCNETEGMKEKEMHDYNEKYRGGSRVVGQRNSQSPVIFLSFTYLRRPSSCHGAHALLFIPVTVFTGNSVRRGMHASLESFVTSLLPSGAVTRSVHS